jgi:CRP/FNR family transcriptional regulator, cyclic AMP receptor protein
MLSETEIVRWKTIAPSLLSLDYHDKAVVYGQGDRLESLFWLLRGIVKLSHITEGGVQLTIDVMGRAAYSGAHWRSICRITRRHRSAKFTWPKSHIRS